MPQPKVNIADSSGNLVAVTSNALDVNMASSLVPSKFDYILLEYTGDNLTTATYKTGGADGTVVAILTLVYDDSTLRSVTKTDS